MIRSTEKILGYHIRAEDGRIGHLQDVLFDDATWAVRYLVADTGNWLPGRKVLVPPLAVGPPDWSTEEVPVDLTRDQIEKSPPLAYDAPVSRREEERLHAHYGWVPYWLGPRLGATGPANVLPGPEPVSSADDEDSVPDPKPGNPHLRSIKEVVGYHIQAEDGEIGHVEDFLVNDEVWALKWLVVDTRNWLPGRKVLVSPLWITRVKWAERIVGIDLTRQQVKDSPEWDPGKPVNVEYERRLFDSYGRPLPKWGNETVDVA